MYPSVYFKKDIKYWKVGSVAWERMKALHIGSFFFFSVEVIVTSAINKFNQFQLPQSVAGASCHTYNKALLVG